jgi:hypothetical protein
VSSSSSADCAGVTALNNAGGPALKAWSNVRGVYAIGDPAGYFEGDVQVTGDIVLINSPASGDVAEDFDVEDEPESSEPGTVLVIDVDGRLSASSQPYDTRVAGVVSGAGQLRPALVLQRIYSTTPRCPVALVGKAYCKVDAGCGPISAGDLLTTSATVGHAMRVSDLPRATGSILGKALAPFAHGRGVIPILVGLR